MSLPPTVHSSTPADAGTQASAMASPPVDLPRVLLHVAWLAVALGIGIELVLLCAALASGQPTGLRKFVADVAQKITWSSIVCVGVALGSTAAKARPLLMGLAAVLAAPIAFHAARVVHKSTAQALSVASAAGGAPGPTEVAILRAIEYACLGALIAWLSRRAWAGLRVHAACGLGIGLVFGTVMLSLSRTADGQPLAAAALVARGLNEVLFPVGCSIALYASGVLGKRLAAAPARY